MYNPFLILTDLIKLNQSTCPFFTLYQVQISSILHVTLAIPAVFPWKQSDAHLEVPLVHVLTMMMMMKCFYQVLLTSHSLIA